MAPETMHSENARAAAVTELRAIIPQLRTLRHQIALVHWTVAIGNLLVVYRYLRGIGSDGGTRSRGAS